MTRHSVSCAALIYGEDLHYLDHLAPLCCLLGIPLIVSEESIASLARAFYPDIHVICYDPFTLSEAVVNQYDLIFYCTPRCLFDEIFLLAQKTLKKRIKTVWCPHGNSDKGHLSPHMEALQNEENALLYGPQMVHFLKSKGVYQLFQNAVITGNFRYAFYQEHASFYNTLAEQLLFQNLPIKSKKFFYAPTWQDYENSCSFFDAASPLIEHLPSDAYLFIKLHPNFLQQRTLELDTFLHTYSSHPQVRFIPSFPSIYPILQKMDCYIGDMSSIGYDFLIFNRPMVFLNTNRRNPTSDLGLYLFRCGIEILPDSYSEVYLRIPGPDLSKNREDTYHYAFGITTKSLSLLRQEIYSAYGIHPKH